MTGAVFGAVSAAPWLCVAVFALLVVETSSPIGFVLPTTPALLALGAAARMGVVTLPVVLLAAATGGVVGDLLGVHLGARLPDRVFARATPRSRALTHRWGPLALLLGRALPGVRSLVPGLLGAAGLGWRRAAPWSAFAALAWVSVELWCGWLLGAVAARA